jgi:ribosome-binding protein aMBF1 (putative translation factor)
VILHERFKAKLQQALLERGWSQAELARRLEMTPQVVNRYMKGVHCPALDMVEKFEQAVGAAPGSLVDGLPLQLLEPVAT